jgi:hypothetical protein
MVCNLLRPGTLTETAVAGTEYGLYCIIYEVITGPLDHGYPHSIHI